MRTLMKTLLTTVSPWSWGLSFIAKGSPRSWLAPLCEAQICVNSSQLFFLFVRLRMSCGSWLSWDWGRGWGREGEYLEVPVPTIWPRRIWGLPLFIEAYGGNRFFQFPSQDSSLLFPERGPFADALRQQVAFLLTVTQSETHILHCGSACVHTHTHNSQTHTQMHSHWNMFYHSTSDYIRYFLLYSTNIQNVNCDPVNWCYYSLMGGIPLFESYWRWLVGAEDKSRNEVFLWIYLNAQIQPECINKSRCRISFLTNSIFF